MNIFRMSVVFGVFVWSFSLLGCIDPPTKFKLTQSSFASVPMQVSSSGVMIGEIFKNNVRVYYSEKARGWCVSGHGEPECKLKQYNLKNEQGQIVGVFFFDHPGKKATLKQVKTPFSKTSFATIDATSVVFEDKSDPEKDFYGSNVLHTTAVKSDGSHLGSVYSEHLRAAKGLEPPAGKDAVDLASETTHVAGCGGVKQQKEEFQVGDH